MPPKTSIPGKVLSFPVRNHSPHPEGPDSPSRGGPRNRDVTVLDVVAIDMANRWWIHDTSIVTIRRKLNVSVREAERIVRKGMRLRSERRAA